MRYDLGFMDMYLFVVSGTTLENNPMFKIKFKNYIDPVKLEDAVYRAIKFHPLFGTQVRYDKRYYLQDNNRPILLIHASENNRPLCFGSSTNGYPWQICWFDKNLVFEWEHGVTDGRGAFNFLKTVLDIYSGTEFAEVPRKINLGFGWEPFADSKEKGKDYREDPEGFSKKAMPAFRRGYKADCHVLSANTSEVMSIAKRFESSPSAVLSVLLSLAIRKHLPENTANRNVACNVVIDLRKPLQYETMHNSDDFLRITYQDYHDQMSFGEVCHKYKEFLDHARIRENLVRMITKRVTLQKLIYCFPFRWMRYFLMYMYGVIEKDRDCNCQVTYLGKTDFSKQTNSVIEDFQFCAWPDFGECTIAAVDFDGTFNLNICENYIEKGIVEDFISLCAEQGITWAYNEHYIYEQAHFEEESIKNPARKNGRTVAKMNRKLHPSMGEPLSSPTIFL